MDGIKRSTARRSTPRCADADIPAIISRVVSTVMPQEGSSITLMTGLTRQNLRECARAIAEDLESQWDPFGGMSKHSFISSRLRFRLVDLLRESNSIKRGNYAVLTRIWRKMSELQACAATASEARRVTFADACRELLAEPDSKLSEVRVAAALRDYLANTPVHHSSLRPKHPQSKYEREYADESLLPADDRASEEERIATCESVVRQIAAALHHQDCEWRYVGFLYLFAGLRMKAAGAVLDVSESRTSQVLKVMIPEALEIGLGIELEDFNPFEDVPYTKELRAIVRRVRKECTAFWELLPEDKQDEILGDLFPERQLPRPPTAERTIDGQEGSLILTTS